MRGHSAAFRRTHSDGVACAWPLNNTVSLRGVSSPTSTLPSFLQHCLTPPLVVVLNCQSLDTPFRMWAGEARVAKYNTFFGPDVWCEVVKVSGDDKLVGVKITTGQKPADAALAPAAAPGGSA